jgi:hypothetical protein
VAVLPFLNNKKIIEMKQGQQRFEFYLQQVQTLLQKAAKQKNAALWLYKNNGRTPFFMLEGLAKMYISLHNKKKFTKLKAKLKLIEDGLGQMDYYDWLQNSVAKNKAIPTQVKLYFKAQLNNKTTDLHTILTEDDWINDDKNRITEITKKLADAKWLDPSEEINAIAKFYTQSIYEINEFAEETKLHFDNLEEDVHELRRKLRWLSIYPQALQGCVQLKKINPQAASLKKYLTTEVINSPFNKFPAVGKNKAVLYLNQSYFLSLSWLIAELGKIKDEGLQVVGLKEALQQTEKLNDEDAYQKAYTLLDKKQTKLPALLVKAEAICKVYFAEKNLGHLVVATTNIKK